MTTSAPARSSRAKSKPGSTRYARAASGVPNAIAVDTTKSTVNGAAARRVRRETMP